MMEAASSSSSSVTKRNGTKEQEQKYLKLVRDAFGSNDSIRYIGFLKVMKSYNEGKYDTMEIISFARAFFKGYPELLIGFNVLLPKGYSIDSSGPEMDLPDELRNAVEVTILVHKVKTRLENDKPCYDSFLDLLNLYRMGLCSIQILCQQIPFIFQDYPDLLAEFEFFLS